MYNSTIEKLESELWHLGFQVPSLLVKEFKANGITRFLCSINNSENFHTAIFSDGNGGNFITINKEQIKKMRLKEGSQITFSLTEDNSKYGMYLPPEMEELLEIDEEGNKFFHMLTAGKQRTLLHLIGKIKSSDIRIKRSIAIIDYLKSVNGQLDFKELNEAIKASNQGR